MNVFPRAMWLALAPHIAAAFALVMAAGVAYEQGAPAWVVHLAGLLGALIVAPGAVRWERRHGED